MQRLIPSVVQGIHRPLAQKLQGSRILTIEGRHLFSCYAGEIHKVSDEVYTSLLLNAQVVTTLYQMSPITAPNTIATGGFIPNHIPPTKLVVVTTTHQGSVARLVPVR